MFSIAHIVYGQETASLSYGKQSLDCNRLHMQVITLQQETSEGTDPQRWFSLK